MTQDEIIEMANKAYAIDDGKPLHPSALFHLEIFAKLVAQRTWVGLTRDEILEARWHNKSSYKFARVLEAKLKEKNT